MEAVGRDSQAWQSPFMQVALRKWMTIMLIIAYIIRDVLFYGSSVVFVDPFRRHGSRPKSSG